MERIRASAGRKSMKGVSACLFRFAAGLSAALADSGEVSLPNCPRTDTTAFL
jgi:hypothetical protein